MVDSRLNSHLLSLAWLMLLILPNGNLFYFFVPASFLLLYRFSDGTRLKIKVLKIVLVACLSVTTLMFFNEYYVGRHDVLRIIVLIILFVSFGRLKGIAILKPYIYIAVIYLIVSQFAFVFKITFLESAMRILYPYEGERDIYGYLETVTLSDIGNRRLGGIFFNPNHYARYMELILVTILCEFKQFKTRELAILIPVIVVSLIASGSRTAFLVAIAIAIAFLHYNKKLNIKYILALGLIFAVVTVFLNMNVNLSEMRMLKLDEGMENSLGVKLGLLGDYFNSSPEWTSVLFGNLSTSVLLNNYGFSFQGTDFEIGDIIVNYGFIFLLVYIAFLIVVYRRMLPRYRVVFIMLLWMFTSTLLCNYRMAPLFMLTLGLYYRRSLIERI